MDPLISRELDQIIVQDWEIDLLRLPYNEIMKILHIKFNYSFETLNNKVFSLNDFLVYFAENYDSCPYNVPRHYVQYNLPLSKRINSAGGRVKINLDQNVNFIVCEPHNIERIVQNFVRWRDSALEDKLEDFRDNFQRVNKVAQPKKDLPPKSKRAALLLTFGFMKDKSKELNEPQKVVEMITKNLPVHFLPQLYKSDPNILNEVYRLEKHFKLVDIQHQQANQRKKLMNKSRRRKEWPRRTQIQLHQLNFHLSQDFDILIQDFQILFTLFLNKHCLWMGNEQISHLCNKFTHFSDEYVTKGLIQNEFVTNCRNQIFMFTKREHYQPKKSLVFAHLFPTKWDHYEDKIPYRYNPNEVLVPKFHLDTPKQCGIFIDDAEHEQIMKDKAKREREYEQALIRHESKPGYLYTLEIPQPAAKCNFCFSCDCQFDDYFEHINSALHKKKVNSSKYKDLWDEVDQEIIEMNQQNLIERTHQLEEFSKNDFSIGLTTQTQSYQQSQPTFDRRFYRATRLNDQKTTKRGVQQQEAMLQIELNHIMDKPRFQGKKKDDNNQQKEEIKEEEIYFGKRKRPHDEIVDRFQNQLNLNQTKQDQLAGRMMKQDNEFDQQENRFNHLFTYNKEYVKCDYDFKKMPFK